MQGKLDVAYGCPIDGIDIGGGVHASKAQSQTVHYGPVLKHPTLANWAAVCDKFPAGNLTTLSVSDQTAVTTATDLTPDWFP